MTLQSTGINTTVSAKWHSAKWRLTNWLLSKSQNILLQCLYRDWLVTPDSNKKWHHSGGRLIGEKWHHLAARWQYQCTPNQKSKQSDWLTYNSTKIVLLPKVLSKVMSVCMVPAEIHWLKGTACFKKCKQLFTIT